MRGSRVGDRGSGPPVKSQKYKFFLAILVRISLQTTMLPSKHSMFCHHRRFAGGLMMARLKWYLDPSSPYQIKKNVKVGPSLTNLSGSAHETISDYMSL